MTYLSKFVFLSIFFLSSCGHNPSLYKKKMDSFASENNFEKKIIQSQGFEIVTYQKIQNPSSEYIFYIEGDGLIFDKVRYQITKDPTPNSIFLIELANMDMRDNIVYVARPCQFIDIDSSDVCKDNKLWTSHRYSPKIISVMRDVINKISLGKNYQLIGFSGGGGIASLIAKDSNNISSLVTIAGNIDHVSFNEYQNSAHMTGSLNPVDYAKELAKIPQIHYSGSRDRVVVSSLLEQAVNKIKKTKNANKNIHHITIKGAGHDSGWASNWPKMLVDIIRLKNEK